MLEGMEVMNREIKFRAWDKNEKKMIRPPVEFKRLLRQISDRNDNSLGGDAIRRHDLDWMQFTGLHDRGGKEIYEGDLFKYTVKVTVRQRPERRNGRKTGYLLSDYANKEVVGVVTFGSLKRGTMSHGFYVKTDEKESYNSAFYAGMGFTAAERRANESRPVSFDLSRMLIDVIDGEVVGNIYEATEPNPNGEDITTPTQNPVADRLCHQPKRLKDDNINREKFYDTSKRRSDQGG